MAKTHKPPPISSAVVARMQSYQETGVDREELIEEMRRSGLRIVECIKLTRLLYGLSLSGAKQIVHFSRAWSDTRPGMERLHDAALQALLDDSAPSSVMPPRR